MIAQTSVRFQLSSGLGVQALALVNLGAGQGVWEARRRVKSGGRFFEHSPSCGRKSSFPPPRLSPARCVPRASPHCATSTLVSRLPTRSGANRPPARSQGGGADPARPLSNWARRLRPLSPPRLPHLTAPRHGTWPLCAMVHVGPRPHGCLEPQIARAPRLEKNKTPCTPIPHTAFSSRAPPCGVDRPLGCAVAM